MQYNIHPIIVHFPIALLFVYSVMKVLPLEKWLPSIAWRQIQNTFLFFGVVSAFVATSTGELAQELTNPLRDLVEMHETFASMTVWFFSLILLGEVLKALENKVIARINISWLRGLLLNLAKLLTNKTFVIVLAIFGLVSVFVTGVLGGVMVYGLSADPLAPIVLKILGIQF